MKKSDKFEVPLSDPDNHPIIICLQENALMKRYDLVITVGNFRTTEAAIAYANEVKRFLEDEADGSFKRVS